jgi:hypothetical protein
MAHFHPHARAFSPLYVPTHKYVHTYPPAPLPTAASDSHIARLSAWSHRARSHEAEIKTGTGILLCEPCPSSYVFETPSCHSCVAVQSAFRRDFFLLLSRSCRVGRKIKRTWRQNLRPGLCRVLPKSISSLLTRARESCPKTPESSASETLAAFLSSPVFVCTCNFSSPERFWIAEPFWRHFLIPMVLIPVLSSRTTQA